MYHEEKKYACLGTVVSVIERGPLRVALRLQVHLSKNSILEQVLIMMSDMCHSLS